jgi:uncharacterized protein (TIGR00251 family)
MRISVRVTANAKKAGVIKVSDANYKARVDAPANGGRANERLIEILSEHFNVKKSGICILSGLKSRSKIIEIDEHPTFSKLLSIAFLLTFY